MHFIFAPAKIEPISERQVLAMPAAKCDRVSHALWIAIPIAATVLLLVFFLFLFRMTQPPTPPQLVDAAGNPLTTDVQFEQRWGMPDLRTTEQGLRLLHYRKAELVVVFETKQFTDAKGNATRAEWILLGFMDILTRRPVDWDLAENRLRR